MTNKHLILPTLLLSIGLATALLFLALRPAPLPARTANAELRRHLAVISFVSGDVQTRTGDGPWHPARRGQGLRPGSALRTGPDGRAEVTFEGRPGRLRLTGGTRLSLQGSVALEGVVVESGSVWAQVTESDRDAGSFALSAGGIDAYATNAIYRVHATNPDSVLVAVYRGTAHVAGRGAESGSRLRAGRSVAILDGNRLLLREIGQDDDWQDGWLVGDDRAQGGAGARAGAVGQRSRALRRELTDISPEVYLSVQLELKGQGPTGDGFRADEVQIRRIRIRSHHWDGLEPDRKVRLLNETFSALKDRYPHILHSVVLEFDDGRPDLALNYGASAAG